MAFLTKYFNIMRLKGDINEQVEALKSQAKTVMNETDVPVDERIQRAADIYRQAETQAEEDGLDDQHYESLLADSAKFFNEYGMYKEALPRYSRLVALREKLFGLEDSATASVYHDIGETYRNLCDLPNALMYGTKGLNLRKKLLGEKHVDTALSYNDTGLIYFYQGMYDKATEPIWQSRMQTSDYSTLRKRTLQKVLRTIPKH